MPTDEYDTDVSARQAIQISQNTQSISALNAKLDKINQTLKGLQLDSEELPTPTGPGLPRSTITVDEPLFEKKTIKMLKKLIMEEFNKVE